MPTALYDLEGMFILSGLSVRLILFRSRQVLIASVPVFSLLQPPVLLIRALPVLIVVPFAKDEAGVGSPKAEGVG